MRLNAEMMSSLEKYCFPEILDSVSRTKGIG